MTGKRKSTYRIDEYLCFRLVSPPSKKVNVFDLSKL